MRVRLSFLAVLLASGCAGGGGSSPTTASLSADTAASPSPGLPTPTHAPGSTSSPTPQPTQPAAPHATQIPVQPKQTPVQQPTPASKPTATAIPAPNSTPTPLPKPTASAQPTITPAPSATPISILSDTNPASSGVFIGDTCVSPHNDFLCVTGYAPTYRHSLSFYVSFTDWSTSLASFIASENMSGWQALNVSPLITWDPIGVQYTDVIAGKWDAYLTASAQAVKAFNGTVFLRPFHEFNGDYTSYGLANQGANATADANFIATWQHMVTVFRQQGVTNVRWVWCYSNNSVPNARTNPWNDPVNAYPGDSYVDWVAFDAFNRGNRQQGIPWLTFDQLIEASYAKAVGISPSRPVMIAELGSNEWGDGGALKSQWISAMFNELPSAYPHLRAIDYFNLTNGDFAYGLQSTPAAYNAWVSGLRTFNSVNVLNFRGYGLPLDGLTSWQ